MHEVAVKPGAPDPRAKLAREQLRLALKNLKPNCWMMPVFAGVMCIMFARWIDMPVLTTWFAVVTLGGAPLGFVAIRFLNIEPGDPAERSAVTWATMSYVLFTLAWCSM